MTHILMPLGLGQSIAPEVLRGICAQTIPCSLVVATAPMWGGTGTREWAINHARTQLQIAAKDIAGPVILMDSDVVLTPTAVERLLQAHKQEKRPMTIWTKSIINWDAEAIEASKYWGHVCCALCCLDAADYRGLDFAGDLCQCGVIAQALGVPGIVHEHLAHEVIR